VATDHQAGQPPEDAAAEGAAGEPAVGEPAGEPDAEQASDEQVREALAAIEAARAAAADGDAAGTIRALRALPERLLLADRDTFASVAGLVAAAARAADFRDLAEAADGARSRPDDAHALYSYGYSCVERGVGYLAVPVLTRALIAAPQAATVRMELVSALEAEGRHAEAVRVLAGSDAMDRWIGRYLLVFNSLMAGDIDGARQFYTRLGPPEEPSHNAMLGRLTAMLRRVQRLTGAADLDAPIPTPQDPRATLGTADLRGWHFVLNGGVLTTLSPYGADAGMNGRYAYLAETLSSCHWAVHRLDVALRAARRRPRTVALLPDRSSRILGLAAAELLGLQAWDWRPQMEGALVVAYSLTDLAPQVLSGLASAPGQLLLEHATSWTDPPPVAADATTLLHQVVLAPWDGRRTPAPGGDGWTEDPADDRPEREIAADILAAPREPDPGDGTAPDDSDDVLAAFAYHVAPLWVAGEPQRDRVWSPGPVPSSRFW
jgi:hypothetical protein